MNYMMNITKQTNERKIEKAASITCIIWAPKWQQNWCVDDWAEGSHTKYWRIRHPKSDFRASAIGQKSWVLGKLNKQPFLQFFKFSLSMFHIKKLVRTCLIIISTMCQISGEKEMRRSLFQLVKVKLSYLGGTSKKSKTWVLGFGFWVLGFVVLTRSNPTYIVHTFKAHYQAFSM